MIGLKTVQGNSSLLKKRFIDVTAVTK